MKKILMLWVFLSCGLACLSAETKVGTQPATVVSVENHETPSNYVGSNPTDAPLEAQVYAYDIGLRLDCTMYALEYLSTIDYLPAVFSPGHTVNVEPQKHFMYVEVPGRGEMRLEVRGRKQVRDTSCKTN
jgi:hypothetical protein